MRILMIIDGLPGGGAEKVVLTLCQGMQEMGNDVSLISLRDVCNYPIPAGVHYQVVADHSRTPSKLTELSQQYIAARAGPVCVQRLVGGGVAGLVTQGLHDDEANLSFLGGPAPARVILPPHARPSTTTCVTGLAIRGHT